jgi:NAD(P)-dependent dehydrogenase (short-subunit alcohol dehydrogenase family)
MGHWLITGANRGIGLELCRQLQGRGETVIAVCRQASPELETLGVRIESGVELSNESAIAALGGTVSRHAVAQERVLNL